MVWQPAGVGWCGDGLNDHFVKALDTKDSNIKDLTDL